MSNYPEKTLMDPELYDRMLGKRWREPSDECVVGGPDCEPDHADYYCVDCEQLVCENCSFDALNGKRCADCEDRSQAALARAVRMLSQEPYLMRLSEAMMREVMVEVAR